MNLTSTRAAIERHHHALTLNRIIKHRFVRHGTTTIPGVMRRFDIVPQQSQVLDGLLGKILIGIDPCHAMPVHWLQSGPRSFPCACGSRPKPLRDPPH